jgi:hypothetical protein
MKRYSCKHCVDARAALGAVTALDRNGEQGQQESGRSPPISSMRRWSRSTDKAYRKCAKLLQILIAQEPDIQASNGVCTFGMLAEFDVSPPMLAVPLPQQAAHGALQLLH